jgi:hypothetical protein
MKRQPIWPNFFIVGVAKAGTTSLYKWLSQHPEVYMPLIKEPHYFSSDLAQTVRFKITAEQEYLRLFESAHGFRAVGEASATYFPFGNVVANRIRKAVPQAKILILLRDPIERAYADYLMYYRSGRETLGFYDALRYSPLAHVYVQTYSTPVREWLDVFGEERVLLLMFENLRRNPVKLLRDVAEFLSLSEGPIEHIHFSTENAGGVPKGSVGSLLWNLKENLFPAGAPVPDGVKKLFRNWTLAPKPPIDKQAVEYLRPVFEEDISSLEVYLGRKLPELRKFL